jgi:NAD(P)H dehydrogenase (quinone)
MILVTGTSGALGGLVLDRLVDTAGVDVVAGTRSPGPGGRRIDFDDPATLADGFAGVDVLVVVSAGYAEDDVVMARHGAVVRAAVDASVRHVIYTSLTGSGDLLSIALAHRWTEARLAEAPVAVTVLRNGLYAEIPVGLALASVGAAAETGAFAAPLGTGRMAVVAREDLADVAARVALDAHAGLAGSTSRHAGRTYELEGVAAIGGDDIATALADGLGRPVRYEPAALGDMREPLAAAGLAPYQIGHTLSTFANVSAGLLEPRPGDLASLLADPPRSPIDLLSTAVKAALSTPGGS